MLTKLAFCTRAPIPAFDGRGRFTPPDAGTFCRSHIIEEHATMLANLNHATDIQFLRIGGIKAELDALKKVFERLVAV
jgi:hypothetical protein